MKVQTRLSLYSSLVFAIIFAVISALTYGLYRTNTHRAIYDNLSKTAYITALFYLEEDQLNSEDFDKVRSQFDKLVNNSFYQLYNEIDSIEFGSKYGRISSEYLNRIRHEQRLAFEEDVFLCYGIFYEDNQGDFVVVAREKKEVVYSQLNTLLWILLIAWIIVVLAIVLLSRWISNMAYRPFRKVIRQVKRISTDNLEKQISSPETQDELQELTETFNDLLARISETFVIQKNFVRYVSHEFKTPLMAMMGNLEVFSLKDRTPDEYRMLSRMLIRQVGYTVDDTDHISKFLSDKLSSGNGLEVLAEIKNSELRPSKKLLKQVSSTIKQKLQNRAATKLLGQHKVKDDYILLDEQLIVYDTIMSIVKNWTADIVIRLL